MAKADADKKKRRTFALTDFEDNLLYLIGELNGLGMSSTLAQYIRKESARLKINPSDPAMQELLKKRRKKS